MAGMKHLPAIFAYSVVALGGWAAQAESLWLRPTNDETSIFADRRARRVGDILTIVVQETVSSVNTAEVKTSRENKPSPGIVTNLLNQFLGGLPAQLLTDKAVAKAPAGLQGAASNLPKITIPTLNPEGKDSYQYGGTVTNQQTLTSRVAVSVVDVLPNGNLVIEGIRTVTGSREKICAYLRGVVRAADVSKENTTLSSNVADLDLQFIPEGAIASVRKGWLQRLNEKVRLF